MKSGCRALMIRWHLDWVLRMCWFQRSFRVRVRPRYFISFFQGTGVLLIFMGGGLVGWRLWENMMAWDLVGLIVMEFWEAQRWNLLRERWSCIRDSFRVFWWARKARSSA